MQTPMVSRPEFPDGYLPKKLDDYVTWEQVEERMTTAQHYWLCSVRPDGRPHVVPRWGVWVGGKFYYDGSPETRHARNLENNPQVNLHLEDGEDVVIMEGTAHALLNPDRELAVKVAQAYGRKYAARGYAPEPDQWDNGGLYEFTPRKVLAWTNFVQKPDATRFLFDSQSDD